MIISYWVYIATFQLLILVYQDYKKKMWVDDRHNYLMMGVTISLISHFNRSIWYILALIILVILFSMFLKRFKVIGEGDIKTLTWIFLGFGYINPYQLAWFAMFFLVITGMYTIFKFKIIKYKKPLPFYPVILLSYVVNCIIFGFYTI